MNRLFAVLRRMGPTPELRPSDRDHGLGTCRWCLNIVALSSLGWVHLATGHATCVDPPLGAPLSSAALPLPPAPHRWDLLFPVDASRARIAWTLGIIGGTDATVTALPSTASASPASHVTGTLIGRAAAVRAGSPPRRRATHYGLAGAAPRPGWECP